MKLVHALQLGMVVSAVAAGVSSCGSGPCGPTTCPTGCCDSMGRCETGTQPSACGKGGAACGACAPGQGCTLQICGGPMTQGGGSSGVGGGFSSAGGQAGATGGGSMAGGSAGGSADAGCIDYGEIDIGEDQSGEFVIGSPDSGLPGYEWWSTGIALEAPRNRVDFFTAELYFEKRRGPPRLPWAGSLPANLNFENCLECFSASLGCDEDGNDCQGGDFFATAGSYNFTSAVRSLDAGTFAGQHTRLTFRRWDYENDVAIGTECFTADWTYRAVWPEPVIDGGQTDGGTVDAGADGG